MGELLTVRQLSYRDRAWLSLLVQFVEHKSLTPNGQRTDVSSSPKGASHRSADSRQRRWRDGTCEAIATLDAPLYRRAGFTEYTSDNYKSHMFLGSRVGHTLRLRYNWKQRLVYGATVQQDVGERLAAYGARPWDYQSAHFYYRSDPVRRGRSSFSRYAVAVGDYRLALGQGLLLGSSSWSERVGLLTGLAAETTRLRPNTGTDESRFMRGVAADVRLGATGAWSLTAFASWRKVDGTVRGATAANDYNPAASDTITAWHTDGLHRTLQETAHRGVANQLSGGGRVGYRNSWANVGANAVWLHYDKVYWPVLRTYNRYYMRGHDAGGFSLDCTLRRGRWSLQGEAAIDRSMEWASTWALRWAPRHDFSLVVEERSFSRAFVSPFGHTLQAGSRVQNEHGAMLGMRYSGLRRHELSAYVDVALHPSPVYLADTLSHRFEAQLQLDRHTGRCWTHTLRYRVKGRQQNVTGYRDIDDFTGVLLSWRTTHHLRWQSLWAKGVWNVALGADGACYYAQGTAYDKKTHTIAGAGTQLGALAFARATARLPRSTRVSTMLTAFATDSWAVRCYAAVPQMRGSVSVPAYYGKGASGVVLVETTLWRGLTVAGRLGTMLHTDRDTTGSGVDAVRGRWRTDLALQLRWRM